MIPTRRAPWGRAALPLTLGFLLALPWTGWTGSSSEKRIASEILQLTDLVAFLKDRVRTENPQVLGDPEAFQRLFRRELAQFDLDLPSRIPLDVRSGDLELAGVLIEEQMRRRRSVERNQQVAALDAAFGSQVEGLLGETRRYAPELLPEVQAIFRSIHDDRSAPPEARPLPPVGPRSIVSRVQQVAAARAAERESTPVPKAASLALGPGPEDRFPRHSTLETIQGQLRSAMAAPAARSGEDMLFGDRGFKLASPGTPEVKIRQVEAPRRSGKQVLRELRTERALAALTPAPTRTESPRVASSRKPISLPSPSRSPASRPALPEASPAQLAQVLPSPQPRKQASPLPGKVRKVLDRIVPMVRQQAGTPAEYPTVLRATLATLGIDLPLGFQTIPEEAPASLAERLATAADQGEVTLELETAEAILSL